MLLPVQATQGARGDNEQREDPLLEDNKVVHTCRLVAERTGMVGKPVWVGAVPTTELLLAPGGRAMGRAGAMGSFGGERHAALGIAGGAGGRRRHDGADGFIRAEHRWG